ncbi:hypothetical protein HOT29_gp089 [Microbacterium phage Squash]|uniref:Uncharacterized protein n=1 Tax=Microbacterium phage Squash TaxID=2182357 RepID=A0A2U8ULY1_9CAUD|nr:hypothetical protein HOT29_gp089 [Microbacterium phage Squash]AWN04707.1 hypothetical protein PBI_SQUASH_89 [Microbacterium phage Squash]
MSIATPREIATDALTGYALGADITREDVWQLIVDVIEAERGSATPEIYIVQDEGGDVVDIFRDADEATAAYQDEKYSVIEETIWEPGECAKYRATKCDECEEAATNFWPKLAEPVQMCDSCTHNARRSGWEPGQ